MNAVAEFRRYLGVKAARYTDAQIRKALDAAAFARASRDADRRENAQILDLPDVRQNDDFSCGACAAKSAAGLWGVGPEKLEDWKRALGTNRRTSTHPFAIRDYLASLDLQVEARDHMTLDDLRDYWLRGIPVICPIQEWGDPTKEEKHQDQPKHGPPAAFPYGHYVVVAGLALGKIIVFDPSIDNVLSGEHADASKGLMLIDEDHFLSVWHDRDKDGNQFMRYGIAVGPPGGMNRLLHLTKALTSGKEHLDRLGGELPMIDPEMLKRADFITYPKRIREGSNCSSCRFNTKANGQHQCGFHDEEKGIDLRGQLVGPRNCCGEWDAPGTLRSWKNDTVTKSLWESSKHPRAPKGSEHGGEFSRKDEVGGPTAKTNPYPPPEPEKHPSFPGAPAAKSPDPAAATKNSAELKRPTPDDYAKKKTQHFSPSSWAEHSPLHKSLETKRKMLTTDLSSGVNRAFLLRLADGTKGVFKPQAGESKKSVPSIPAQTGFRREVAASRVADILGMSDLVPTTTFRTEQADGIGSMQAYVAGAKNATEVTRDDRYDGLEDARRAAALDYLFCQIDRHQNNWMLLKGKLSLIDNGRAFPTKYEPREFELSAMFHMEFLRHAVVGNMDVPDLSAWRGKWDAIEKELRDCGIEDNAVHLAKQRYDDLMNRNSRKFADLPGFLEGHTLGQLFAKYGKRPAAFEES